MSATTKCNHGRESLRVECREHNHSAFNGYHKTPSDYSKVICVECSGGYRTKAAWVETCPNLKKGECKLHPEREACV